MSKVVSQENLVDFGQQFKNKLSDVAISGSYNDLVDTPGDLQEYRQFTLFSDQAEGSYPSTPGDNDWKWYTNLDKLAPTSNPNITWYGDWSTVATTTENTPIIWVAVATFQSSDGTKVSDWETYQATGSTGAPGQDGADGQDGQDGADGQKGDTGNGISSITKTGTSGLVDTYTITFTNGNTTTFTVTNGADGTTGPQGVGIESIELTAQASGGSADEYTITLTDGRTSTFDVRHGTNGTNGKSAYEVAVDNGFSGTETQWLESLVGATGNQGTEGNGISSITKTSTSGLVDTYTVSYTNGTSSTFTVTNGANGTNGTNGNGISSTFVSYMLTSTSTAPSSGNTSWSSSISVPTASNKYLWKKTVTTYTNNTSDTAIDLISMYTDPGDIEYIGGFNVNTDDLTGTMHVGNDETTMVLSPQAITYTDKDSNHVWLGSNSAGDSSVSTTIYHDDITSTQTVSPSDAGICTNGLSVVVDQGTVAIDHGDSVALIANGEIYLEGDVFLRGTLHMCPGSIFPNAAHGSYINGHRSGITVLTRNTSITNTQLVQNGTFIVSQDGITITLPKASLGNDGCRIRIWDASGNSGCTIQCSQSDIVDFTQGVTIESSISPGSGTVIDLVFCAETNSIYAKYA